jgi:sporulation protein YlmC with PRC-barrel domain
VEAVHDVLDKLVKDRNGRELGRVDGIVVDHRDGVPPRLLTMAIGPRILGYRLHPVAGRWVEALEHGMGVDDGRPVRIAFADVTDFGTDIKVDLTIGETAAGAIEKLFRAWVARIPGAR